MDPRPAGTPEATEGTATRRMVWFTLGLVGLVYVIGVAGLWSTFQRFDRSMALESRLRTVLAGSSDQPFDTTLSVGREGHRRTDPLQSMVDEVKRKPRPAAFVLPAAGKKPQPRPGDRRRIVPRRDI